MPDVYRKASELIESNLENLKRGLNFYELTHNYSGSVDGLSAYLGLQSQLPIPSYANQRFTSIQNIL